MIIQASLFTSSHTPYFVIFASSSSIVGFHSSHNPDFALPARYPTGFVASRDFAKRCTVDFSSDLTKFECPMRSIGSGDSERGDEAMDEGALTVEAVKESSEDIAGDLAAQNRYLP